MQKSKNNNLKRLTIGICTVSTRRENYLLDTLSSLLQNSSPNEQECFQIVLFDCDATPEESSLIGEARATFQAEITRGLIEIVRTQPTDYLKLTDLQPTLGDSLKRTYWRSKQCLDYSLIFQYCAGKGSYYLHLEDDVIGAENFYTKICMDIERFADSGWSAIQFCELGFIGMLFKDDDLNKIGAFIKTFYDEMPVDWLITYFFALRQRHGQEFITVKRSLFQHMGYYSSLDGKTSSFRSKSFGNALIHDKLWERNETRRISKVLFWSDMHYKKLKAIAKRVLKQRPFK